MRLETKLRAALPTRIDSFANSGPVLRLRGFAHRAGSNNEGGAREDIFPRFLVSKSIEAPFMTFQDARRLTDSLES